jgi:O-antigen/teichoic acid export membrane protein
MSDPPAAEAVAFVCSRGMEGERRGILFTLSGTAVTRLRRSAGTVLSILDQGLLSAANVGTGILAGRLLGAAALGTLTLQLSLLFLSAAVLQSTLATTLMSLRSSVGPARSQRMAAQFLTLTALGSIACGVAAAVVVWWGGDGASGVGMMAAAIGLVFPAFLLRDYLRWYQLASSCPGSALALDAVAVFTQFALILSMWALDILTLAGCLFAMAAGNGLAIAAGLVRWKHGFVVARAGVIGAVREALGASAWVLAAILLFLLGIQIMPWLVTAQRGVAEAGSYAACAALANAANPIVSGFINIMMPKAAEAFRRGGHRSTLADGSLGTSSLKTDTVALSAIAGAASVIVAVTARSLLSHVYGSGYSPAASLLVLLACAFFVRSAAGMPYIGLWALGRANYNAFINFGALVTGSTAALVLMPRLGLLGAGAGVLFGELLAAATRWVLFGTAVRAWRRAEAL